MKSLLHLSLLALMSLQVQGSHFDDIEAIENLKWDKVKFKTKKDCSLDNYPEVSKFHPNYKPNVSN